MNPKDQRITIAEACGWKFHKLKGEFRFVSIHPDGQQSFTCEYGEISHLPDYLNDLNAMHEAEKVLSDHQRDTYYQWLCQISRVKGKHVDYSITATAAQRAEAFLKTLNLWKE